MDFDWTEEDRLGMSLQPGSVSIEKDSQNLLGISIGGGAPLCPCLYIVQVFDNTPAAKSGVLEAGDELVAVNSTSVKGKTKVEVARMIQNVRNEVTIGYNKLSCEASQGKSFDIVLKKMKHKMVENMSSSTADALGLSRAILCNDGLIKKMQEMEKIAAIYRGMMNNTRGLLWGYLRMAQAHRLMGEVFSQVGAKEPQFSASEGFRKYGEAHRSMEKFGVKLVRTVKPMVSDLDTYLNKAIPDTKHTIRKYADVKFEYLSFCLKVKELDDEEYSYASLNEPLYRVETGNYEYRLVLRCRQEARARFARLRADVLEKIELLDNKHVQDIVYQLQRFVAAMSRYNNDCRDQMVANAVFPIEVDLMRSTLTCSKKGDFSEDGDGEGDHENILEDDYPEETEVNAKNIMENDTSAGLPTTGCDTFLLDQLADFTSQPQSSSLGQMSNQDMFGDVNLFDFDQTLNPNSMGQANPNPNSILPTSHRPGNSSNGIEQKLENINLLD